MLKENVLHMLSSKSSKTVSIPDIMNNSSVVPIMSSAKSPGLTKDTSLFCLFLCTAHDDGNNVTEKRALSN